MTAILTVFLATGLVYWMLAPREFEATAHLALQDRSVSELRLGGAEDRMSGSFASGTVQLETLADALRSDQLAWQVITRLKLDRSGALPGGWRRPARPPIDLDQRRAYLLDVFRDRLRIRTIPRTLVLEVSFRSGDAATAANVVNELIREYRTASSRSVVEETAETAHWLEAQLNGLQARAEHATERAAAFERQHSVLLLPEGGATIPAATRAVSELEQHLANATAERIRCEAEFRALQQGKPGAALADSAPVGEGAEFPLLRQIDARVSDLSQELSRLRLEHGPNFPRVLEIQSELRELNQQRGAEEERIRQRTELAWRTSVAREAQLRDRIRQLTKEGLEANADALKYEALRREAASLNELYVQAETRVSEASLAAAARGPEFRVLDEAHAAAKPVRPNLFLSLGIALLAGVWIAWGVAFVGQHILEAKVALSLMGIALLAPPLLLQGQPPTPSTSGLPTGVARIPLGGEDRPSPNAKDAPQAWNDAIPVGDVPATHVRAASGLSPIGAGDLVEVTEPRTPDFHVSVRVSAEGSVALPMIGEIGIAGMDEATAAHAIERALEEGGFLLHPHVNLIVTAAVGRDVTVLGEVARPGIYPLGVHHRLLDMISAASGFSATAGSTVTITPRGAGGAPLEIVRSEEQDPSSPERNPELKPGDVIRVSRAQLVYVVGHVIRPGGFMLDPTHETTVLQVLSLAWGPAQNARVKEALLIHQQGDGRSVTKLNLKRMLRGEDPDLPVMERDILFVPDSAIRNLWNRTMESVVQSAAGVSIYSGLVYSQRY